ncbi:MAG: dienelactone hydrolase family protein [Planctomycetota bacterium]
MNKPSALTTLGLLLLVFCASGANAGTAKQEQLHKQYEDTLKSLKDDDEAGYQRLAQWCQQNKLVKEAEQTWNLLLGKKREKLEKNPSAAGYQALAAWCTTAGLKQGAEDVRHDMLAWDYSQRKAKLKPDDPKELLALAQWCQQSKLNAEALECLQDVLKLQPDNASARSLMNGVRAACWVEAPTGLLKHQKVPSYTQETAWYHISVPKEHRETKTGLPLIVYLHGGQHNAGTADNIVALAQVIPAFKKNIVLFPNHLKTWWAHPRELKYLLDTLDEVTLRWHVDPKRIYLMGGSMGGNGVWAFGCQCPELFAALSPMAGFYADFLEFQLKNIVSKPIYIVHGTKDTTVPIDGARKAFEILKKDGANIEMHEVDCGHQPPNEEITKAADWVLQYTNKQDFDLKALKERIAKLAVPGWLKQYEGN